MIDILDKCSEDDNNIVAERYTNIHFLRQVVSQMVQGFCLCIINPLHTEREVDEQSVLGHIH